MFARVDDADEHARCRRDDFFAGQRGAAALDQATIRVTLVGAVDVQRNVADRVEIEHGDAVLLEPLRRLFGTRYSAFDLMLAFGQRIDEMRDGRSGADADDHAVFDIAYRGAAGEAFFFVLRHSSVPVMF